MSRNCRSVPRAIHFSFSSSMDEAGPPVPMSVFRDTGVSHNAILKEAVSFLEDAYTG